MFKLLSVILKYYIAYRTITLKMLTAVLNKYSLKATTL